MTLILFSGGVESTALAAMSNKNATLLHVDVPYTDVKPGYDIAKVRQIAQLLDRELVEYKQLLPIKPKTFIHQINWFLCAVHLVLLARPYKEVWWGMHRGESHKHHNWPVERRQMLLQAYTAHYQLHPKVPWLIPLEDKTKLEQWIMIPLNIRPLVVSCISAQQCNQCTKCTEFNQHIGKKNFSLKNISSM
jgi:7-cyano-7-deazaguanine synthase in queuosine biosynthesis